MGYEVLLVVTTSVVLPPRKKKRPEVFPQDAFTYQHITLFFFNLKSPILPYSPLTVSYPAAFHSLIPPAMLVTFSNPAAFKMSRPVALRLPERQYTSTG